jgi:hypothetical protein
LNLRRQSGQILDVRPGYLRVQFHGIVSDVLNGREVAIEGDAGLLGWAAGRGRGFSNPDHVLTLTPYIGSALPDLYP